MEFPQGLGKRVTIGDIIVPQSNRPEAVSYIKVQYRRVQISLLFSLRRTVFEMLQFLIRAIC